MPPRNRGFGPRGRSLWADLTTTKPLVGLEKLLAEEACRIADRLDKLDALIRGKDAEWLHFREDIDGREVTVMVDGLLAEARQQATAMRALVAELAKSHPAATSNAVLLAPAVPKPESEASPSDDLASRRAERLAGASAS